MKSLLCKFRIILKFLLVNKVFPLQNWNHLEKHDEFFTCRTQGTQAYLTSWHNQIAPIPMLVCEWWYDYCYDCKNVNQLIHICTVGSPNINYTRSKGRTVSTASMLHSVEGIWHFRSFLRMSCCCLQKDSVIRCWRPWKGTVRMTPESSHPDPCRSVWIYLSASVRRCSPGWSRQRQSGPGLVCRTFG